MLVQKRLLLLTGEPGVGKTTVLVKVVEALKMRGYSVGGMISRETREDGVRVGFEIVDIATGRRGWLAHVNQPTSPRIGRYRVNLADLEGVGVEAIGVAVKTCDVVVIDEIGPMELFSEKFKITVRKAIESEKLVVAVVHWRVKDRLVEEAKMRDDAELAVVTHENRNRLHEEIVEMAVAFLKFKRY